MEKFNEWSLKSENPFGEGGSSSVYECESSNKEIYKKSYVLKKLNKSSKKREDRKKRLINEIETLKKIDDLRVIKLVDSYKNGEEIWYVMEKGESITSFLKSQEDSNGSFDKYFFKKIFKNAIFLFKTLKKINTKGIYHRDIKPENLIKIKNKVVFIDFGVSHNKEKITNLTEKYDKHVLGAKFYMAPEMRRTPATADYSSVDIYSLTKTLWACITGQDYSFDGEYSRISNNFLKYNRSFELKYFNKDNLERLHVLFERNTSNNVNLRMSIDETITLLDDFIYYGFNDYGLSLREYKNKAEKTFYIKKIFPKIRNSYSSKLSLKKLDSDIINLLYLFDSDNVIEYEEDHIVENNSRNIIENVNIEIKLTLDNINDLKEYKIILKIKTNFKNYKFVENLFI